MKSLRTLAAAANRGGPVGAGGQGIGDAIMHRLGYPFCCLLVISAMGLLPAGSVRAADPAGQRPRQPNIVFFLADDMGWRDAGCYGSTFYETPNIDRLAKQGMRFTSAYAACPVCSPTRASIMTGNDLLALPALWQPGGQSGKRRSPRRLEIEIDLGD